MGNSLPLPCVCQCHHEDDGAAAAAGAKKRRRKQRSRRPARRNVRAARPRHVVPVVEVPAEDGGDGWEEAWRSGCRVERPAGCGEDGGGVRRVKIVMRRKDIAELVARLEQRDAEERSAAMMEAELNAGLGVGGDGGDGRLNDGGRGGSVTMSPCRCRDAWRPRLSIIPENY